MLWNDTGQFLQSDCCFKTTIQNFSIFPRITHWVQHISNTIFSGIIVILLYFICSKHPIKVKTVSSFTSLNRSANFNELIYIPQSLSDLHWNQQNVLFSSMDSANHTTSRDYHCFFCRFSIIYNPRISFINFDQQQARLLDSCSAVENKIFISLTVDHLAIGDSGILRQLLFSIIHPVD